MIPKYESWEVVRKIGSGSFGTVYEIKREDFGYTYRAALKVISIPQSVREIESARLEGMDDEGIKEYFGSIVEEIVKEFEMMFKLRGNTNIVSYEDHIVKEHEDEIGWDVMIRMELLTSLNQYIRDRAFTRRDVICLGIDICRALERCQKFNIIHRDIKLDNIFVSEQGDYKLGDFGIARTIEKTMLEMSKKGTYSYMAPEVYRGDTYGFSVDLYSLGIVMYRLLNNNRTPFMPPYPEVPRYQDQEKAIRKRMSGEEIPLPANDSTRLAEIVLKATAYDPKERYSSPAQMREDLESILYSETERDRIMEDDSIAIPEGNSTFTHDSYLSESKEDKRFMENETISLFTARTEKEQKESDPKMDKTVSIASMDIKEETVSVVSQEVKEETVSVVSQEVKEETVSVVSQEVKEETVSAVSPEVKEETVSSASQKGKDETTISMHSMKGNVPTKEAGKKKSPLSILLICALLALLCGGGYFGWYMLSTVSVPAVAGMQPDEAISLLTANGLDVVEGEPENNDEIAKGQVIRVNESGRQKKDSQVTLVLSLGKAVEVPMVMRKEGKTAQSNLEKAGLHVVTKEEYSDKYEEGIVMKQNQPEGRILNEGDDIEITISKGPKPFKLAKYTGKTYDAAKKDAEKLGLIVKKKESFSMDVKKGNVISQDIKSGTQVRKGDTITFTVSKGIEQIKVPSVAGKSESSARETIKNAGFSFDAYYEYSSSVDSGYVIAQDKEAGTKINKGSTITVAISRGPRPVQRSSSSSSSSSRRSSGSTKKKSSGGDSDGYDDSKAETIN